MLKKQLWTSLSTTLRRVLPPTSRFSVDSMHVKQFPTRIFSSCSLKGQKEPRVFIGPRPQFIWSREYPVKYFCSVPSEIVRPRCWNCDAVPQAGPFLVCESCQSVQPVNHSLDYFQIFALEKKYEIGDENLGMKYKDWQKKLHPDLVHSKSERERDYAAEQSARVIDAYRTLTNPLSRAIYILKLEGIVVDEEKTISDPDLLAEILEIREAVEEAAGSQELNQIQARIDEKLRHWSRSFASAFRSRKFEDALTSIQRMTYYKRVNEEIVKKL